MLKNSTAEGVFINLVSSVINNRKPDALPDGIIADEIFAIGCRQDMAPITFCAMNSITPKPVSEKWAEYQKRFLDDCMRSEVQMSEYRKLVEYLCGHGVRILPLKGCVLKNLYPAPNLRVMSDVDLMYDGVTEKKLAALMKQAGYSIASLSTGCHDSFYKKPCMNIELHRTLIMDDSPYKPVLENMFDRAVPDEKISNLYHMKPEDLYIHVIVHAAKHFRSSGLGLRPVGDIYTLNRAYGQSWDRDAINRQLSSVGLSRFEAKMRDMAYAFFGSEERVVSEEEMKLFFRGSTYGKYSEGIQRGAIASGNNNTRYMLKRIFMSPSELKKHFPVLRKHPYLYPFVSVYRWVDRALHCRNNVKQVFSLNHLPEDQVQEVRKIMKEYGLNG